MRRTTFLLAGLMFFASPFGLERGARADNPVSILLIGDSHSYGTFGEALDLLLRSRDGARVKTVGSCGLSPNGFLSGLKTQCGLRIYEADQTERVWSKFPTPTIASLLAEMRPALTVIALGANQIETATSQPATQKAFVERLVSSIRESGSACLWVGPPHGRNKTEPKFTNLYQVLQEGVGGRCAFFDSRPEHLPYLQYDVVAAKAGKEGDGRHYDALGPEGRSVLRRWALEVLRAADSVLTEI